MAVKRQMFKLQKMHFRSRRTLACLRIFRESSSPFTTTSKIRKLGNNFVIDSEQTPFLSLRSNLDQIKSSFSLSFPRPCISGLSQDGGNIYQVSVLEHSEYEKLRKKLETKTQSALDCACLHILLEDKLKVSQTVLDLNAVSLYSIMIRSKIRTSKLKELEQKGLLIFGKYNMQEEKVLLANFTSLVVSSGVEMKALEEDLFAPTSQGPGKTPDREFRLKRNLIGFFLLSGLKDSHMRLPVDALNRLSSILFGGKFTKNEDKIILDWVDRHGPNKWTGLAEKVDRYHISGPSTVMARYRVLTEKRQHIHRADVDEDIVLLAEVLKQDKHALSKMVPTGITWEEIAEKLNRPSRELYRAWVQRILPTLRRHLAGTLQHDVREELIKEVARRGWQFSTDIKFPILASMTVFKGHTPNSLSQLYLGMVLKVMAKQKKAGVELAFREVTVAQVQECFSAEPMRDKTKKKMEYEKELVSAFNVKAGRDLGWEYTNHIVNDSDT